MLFSLNIYASRDFFSSFQNHKLKKKIKKKKTAFLDEKLSFCAF